VYGISVANTGSSAGIAGMPARTDGLTMTQLAPTGGYADAISDDGNVVWHSTVPGITVRVGTTDYHPTTGGPGSILYTASPSGRYGLFRDPSGLLTVVDRTTWATMTIPSQDDPTGISDLLVVTLNDANGNPFVWTPMWGLMSERDWYMAMMPRLATDSQFLSLSFGPLAGVGDAGGYQDLVSIGSLDRFQVSDSLVTRSTGTGTPEPGSSFLVALGLFAGAGIRRFFSAAKAR